MSDQLIEIGDVISFNSELNSISSDVSSISSDVSSLDSTFGQVIAGDVGYARLDDACCIDTRIKIAADFDDSNVFHIETDDKDSSKKIVLRHDKVVDVWYETKTGELIRIFAAEEAEGYECRAALEGKSCGEESI